MEVAFSHWSASWPVLIGYLAVTAAHLGGLRRLLTAGPAGLPAGSTSRELRNEALLCHLGLVIVLLALVSPLGYWSTVYIWVRAVQTLLVGLIGPGLIAVGAPWPALRASAGRTVGGPAAAAGPEPAIRLGGSSRWARAQPAVATVAFAAVWLALALPAPFDAGRTSSLAALGEHACYLAVGLVFWLQLFGSRPLSPAAPVLRRVAMVAAVVLLTTVLGMVLVFGNAVLYPAYTNHAHHLMTVLADQQLSGAVLWMGALPALIVAAVALLIQWLDNEDKAELSVGLDRLLTTRRNTWPSRPVIR